MKKTIYLICLSILSLILLNSCNKEDVESVYSYGISEYEESSTSVKSGIAILTQYLEEKGCHMGAKIFKSEKKSENDEKAKDFFHSNVSKINEEELAVLLEDIYLEFTYQVETVYSTGEAPKELKSKEFKFGNHAE